VDNDKLIQIIEAEVRKALANMPEEDKPPPKSTRKKATAIFTCGCDSTSEAIKQVEKLIEKGYDVTAVVCPIAVEMNLVEMLEDIGGISEILVSGYDRVDKLADESEVIMIPVLSRPAAAKLALGITDNFAIAVVMQGLITGKPVIAARNSIDPDSASSAYAAADKTPPALIQLAKNYLNTLTSFGMTIVDISELADAADGKPQQNSYLADDGKRPLISKSVIDSIAEGVKEFVIPDNSIVTPLAKEMAKEREIKLVMEPPKSD